jgi:hypothetical protein
VAWVNSGVVEALRRRLSLLTWFALAGVLALALLPTVSHALALALAGGISGINGINGNSAWAEVCTTQGLKRVAAGTGLPMEGGDAPPAPAAGHAAACPFCKLGADSPSLPSGPWAAPAAATARQTTAAFPGCQPHQDPCP